MLHELVVALRGHPGHVFQERDGKFLVNPALSLFHPCEVALLNQVRLKTDFPNMGLKESFNLSLDQVLELAADYRTVASFISRHGSGGEEGMYLEAVTLILKFNHKYDIFGHNNTILFNIHTTYRFAMG